MKRIKMNRRDFIKGSAFITSSAAGASLFAGNNPELEAAPASAWSRGGYIRPRAGEIARV